MTVGFHGLSLLDTVRQSALTHPEWDAKMHMAYLIDDDGFPEAEVMAAHGDIVHTILEMRLAT
jgi:hypothetical protein